MGDTKKFTNKYSTPNHPWKRERIDSEKILRRSYGLKNGREAWKASTKLKNIKDQIKKFMGREGTQIDREREQLKQRLIRYGLMPESGDIEGVLAFNTDAIMERRLQTILVRRGLARTMHQARQYIIHRHVTVADRVVSSPSYIVAASEEATITFKPKSTLSQEDHPERVVATNAKAKSDAERESARRLKAEEDAEVIEVAEEDLE
jgi:small subunit ribosomal protein S4